MARCTRLISRPYHGTTGEDRWAWRRGHSGWTAWVLCDGASEGYDAAGWAQVLADHLADGLADSLPGHLADSLAQCPTDSLAGQAVSPAVGLAEWAVSPAHPPTDSLADSLPGHLADSLAQCPTDSLAGQAVSPAHPPTDSLADSMPGHLADGLADSLPGHLAGQAVSKAVGLAERAVHRARRAYKNQALHKQGKVNRGLHDRTGSDLGASGTGGLDWLSRASLARGSWSTALALRCSPTFSYIEVWAMGDTELFILDGFRAVLHLPLLRAEDFSASPTLIASSASAPEADPTSITAASPGLRTPCDPRNPGYPDRPGNPVPLGKPSAHGTSSDPDKPGNPGTSSAPGKPAPPSYPGAHHNSDTSGTFDRSPRWVCRKINLRPLRNPRLILVSDALASYILGHTPAESAKLWEFLLTEKPEQVYRWLGEEEGHFQLRPDDHTLIEVRP